MLYWAFLMLSSPLFRLLNRLLSICALMASRLLVTLAILFVIGLQAAERAQLFLLMTLAKCGWLVNMAKLPTISQIPIALGY